MCGATEGGLSLDGINVAKEAIIQGQVVRAGEPVGKSMKVGPDGVSDSVENPAFGWTIAIAPAGAPKYVEAASGCGCQSTLRFGLQQPCRVAFQQPAAEAFLGNRAEVHILPGLGHSLGPHVLFGPMDEAAADALVARTAAILNERCAP